MDIGIFLDASTAATADVDKAVANVRAAADAGFRSIWMSQIFGLDTLTTLAVVAREVPGIELGTDVVPVYRQHPMALAQQAMTVSQASGGRLLLGIGLSHQIVVEQMWGLSFDKPARYMQEYLDVLVPLLAGEGVSSAGELVTGHGALEVKAPRPGLVVAALGPRMLRLAGRVTDGTITWMVGPKTLAEHIVPTISAAAEDAGRPAPRIVVSLPICVTDDADDAKARAAQEFAMYGVLPSYRAMLDREGAPGPADIAVIGTADEVAERLHGIVDAGGTTVVAAEFGTPDERAATRAALTSLL
jgi:F420-dependent oxidoreductase-like protein